MIGVGWVVLNRKKHAAFPDTIREVVRQGGEDPPCQFSFWCDGAPEIARTNSSRLNHPMPSQPRSEAGPCRTFK